MDAQRNDDTGTWHLVGTRGCGVDPDGRHVSGSWAEIRDAVARGDGDRCSHCDWPR